METKRITVGGRVEESEIGFNVCGVYEDASSVRTQVWEGGDIEAVSTALRWFSEPGPVMHAVYLNSHRTGKTVVYDVEQILAMVKELSLEGYTEEDHSRAAAWTKWAALVEQRRGNRGEMRWFSKRMMHHHGCLECIHIDAELMTYAR